MQTVYKLGKLPQYQSHMIKIWRHCVSAVANRKLNFIIQGVKMHFIWNRVKIKSLVNSNLDLNPLKRRNICMWSNFRQTIFMKNFYRLFLCENCLVVTNAEWLSDLKIAIASFGIMKCAIQFSVSVFRFISQWIEQSSQSILTWKERNGIIISNKFNQ